MVLAALHLFADEPRHDTLTDVRAVRRVVLKGRPVRERAESAGDIGSALPPVKRPVSSGEQLVPARLSSLRVREAVVRRQSSTSRGGQVLPFRVPDVRISFARSEDRGLRVAREGADGFAISGTALGGKVSIAFDGLIFSVVTRAGASAAEVRGQLAQRISPAYGLELFDDAKARIVSHT